MDNLTADGMTAAASFFADTLPRHDLGWAHNFLSAYQMGCEALAALGQATEVDGGAIAKPDPILPDMPPRPDDICVAVLKLARQQKLLSYRLPDGGLPPNRTGIRVIGAAPPPAPNISPAHGLGAALAAPDLRPLLAQLGLLSGGNQWTLWAQTIHWRIQPPAWDLEVTADPRFGAALQRSLAEIPDDIRTEINRLVQITDADIQAHIRAYDASAAELKARFGPKAREARPMTPQRARQSLSFARTNTLDWVFFHRWRLCDVWLTQAQAERALGIFHDPLAIQMRRAVVAGLYPDKPEFAK